MSDCIFCKLVKRDIPVEPLIETDYGIVIRDRAPVAKEHLLVIPKTHVDDITHADADFIATILQLATVIAGVHLPNGFRIVINTGIDAGQTVKHFHAHVLGGEKLKDL
jgi:histidine triad (HIT) family protein